MGDAAGILFAVSKGAIVPQLGQNNSMSCDSAHVGVGDVHVHSFHPTCRLFVAKSLGLSRKSTCNFEFNEAWEKKNNRHMLVSQRNE